MGNNITKAELVSDAADAADLTKSATEKVMNSILDSIQSALISGKNVTLVGFGTFTTAQQIRIDCVSGANHNLSCS